MLHCVAKREEYVDMAVVRKECSDGTGTEYY